MREMHGRIATCGMVAALTALIVNTGCKVGPNYVEPKTRVNQEWTESQSPELKRGEADITKWWELLNDPALNTLIDRAYEANPTLQAAGIRVLEAQAGR